MEKLYKYIGSASVAENLLEGNVKFTPIKELNDPSELAPTVNQQNVEISLQSIRDNGYCEEDLLHLQRQGAVLRKLAPQFQAVAVPETVDQANGLIRSSFYENTEVLKKLLETTAAVISEQVGIFCLSKRYDSLPMWAHYANNAAGFLVEFRKINTFFTGDKTGVLWEPIEVRYDRESAGVTFDPRSHDAIFFENLATGPTSRKLGLWQL